MNLHVEERNLPLPPELTDLDLNQPLNGSNGMKHQVAQLTLLPQAAV
jgi:hypothetical protein